MADSMTAPAVSPTPVPPRSRTADHVVGMIVALVVAPAGWFACALAAGSFVEAHADGADARPRAFAALLVGSLVLAGIVGWAQRSAVAPIVVGAAYGVAAALVDAFVPAVTNAITDALPATWLGLPARSGAEELFRAQAPVLVGGVMLAAGLTAVAARRAGRRAEREDAARTATFGATVAPRARIGWHLTSVVVGLIAAPVLLAASGSFTAAMLTSESRGRTLAIALLGAAAVALVVGIAAASSLGAFVAGAVWIVTGLGYLVAPDGTSGLLSAPIARLEEALLGAPVSQAAHLLGVTGTVLLVGVVLVGAGVAAHGARRDGRRLERSELALIRARDGAPAA